MKQFGKLLKQSAVLSAALLLICGVIYPLALTGLGQLCFKEKANGSIVEAGGKAIGSSLIGQEFTGDEFFHGRPSAYHYNTYTEEGTYAGTEDEYAGVSSGSNNYAPSSEDLQKRMEADLEAFLEAHPGVSKDKIPADLLTASGSGLDPHISVEGAKVQIASIAKATGLSEEELLKIVENHTKGKTLGVFGEETVNVLLCNLEIAEKTGMLEG